MTDFRGTEIQSFPIDGHVIGVGHPCFIVAEVGQTHDGSLGIAHAYIDAVAESGADGIKFQTHIAAEESTPKERWRIKFSPKDESRFDYWQRMEFSHEEWKQLSRHAKQRGLVFLSSPFSIRAVDLLMDIDIPAWKIGAGEIDNRELVKYVGKTGKPVLLSSGMSSWDELDRAVEWVRSGSSQFAIYQCTSSYPCPPEKLGFNNITLIRDRYRCPIGFSDHSGTLYAGLAAATLGVNLLEVHVAFSRYCFGPDVSSSVTIDELKQLIDGIRFIEAAISHPVDKEMMAVDLSEMKSLFGKSLVAARDLIAGETIKKGDIVCKKPGSGISPAHLESYFGRRVAKPVTKDTLLSEHDFE